eukprot:g14794.t1
MVVEALGFAKSERRRFNDAEYVLSMAGDTESLSIDVEHAEDGRRWRSRFSASFVEEITRKTGNAKKSGDSEEVERKTATLCLFKFDVFVRMLLSALAQESESVYLDILTARDLEMLRRHANPQGPPTANPVAAPSDKRYVILTYRAEFDKVHYPLPLPPDERSQEELGSSGKKARGPRRRALGHVQDVLRGMVGRLKSELAQAHETIAALQGVPAPIEPDKEQLHLLQIQNKQLSEGLQAMQKEAEQLRAELRLRQGQQNHARDDEVLRLRNELTRCKGEVKSLKDELKQREIGSSEWRVKLRANWCERRAREKEAAELRAERQKADRLQSQLKKMEEEKRSLATRLRADRSRPASRTPSAERTRPASEPPGLPPPGARGRQAALEPGVVAGVLARADALAQLLPCAGEARQWKGRASPTGCAEAWAEPCGFARSERCTELFAGLHVVLVPEVPPSRCPRAMEVPSLPRRPWRRPLCISLGLNSARMERLDAFWMRPGSLFAVAADLGLGTSVPPEDEACDIDARLQALQSFLKQTKNIAA